MDSNSANKTFCDADSAKQFFAKKFKEKTANTWEEHLSGDFAKVAGKYLPLELEESDDEEAGDGESEKEILLQKDVADFVRLIFDEDTILNSLKELDLDTKKMPLGKMSKATLARGIKVLEEIEMELKKAEPSLVTLQDKSNMFYCTIPHFFGDKKPPLLENMKMVELKYELLNILGDVEVAASIMKKQKAMKNKTYHQYSSLSKDLEAVDMSSEDGKMINTFTSNTQGYRKCRVMQAIKVSGHKDDFGLHKEVKNRKLLWHGTNIAVVAAILKSGLRIMPHSGGRVGSGIYLASENGKSAGYTSCHGHTGIMFLCEAVLGEQKEINADGVIGWKEKDPVSAVGKDSVLAVGMTEPDPKLDITVKIDGQSVVVPQGKPVVNPLLAGHGGRSSFSQSEYLVYKESQCRIRYVLKMDFSGK